MRINKLKESALYLQFFKKNLLLLLLPVVLLSLAGFYYQTTKPVIHTRSRVLEADTFKEDVQKKVLLIDQAVSTTRQPNILNGLNKNPDVNINVFKIAPLSVNLIASSTTTLPLKEALDNISSYLEERYQLKVVGDDILSTSHPNYLYGILIGVAIGGLIGLLISLIKTYFHSY